MSRLPRCGGKVERWRRFGPVAAVSVGAEAVSDEAKSAKPRKVQTEEPHESARPCRCREQGNNHRGTGRAGTVPADVYAHRLRRLTTDLSRGVLPVCELDADHSPARRTADCAFFRLAAACAVAGSGGCGSFVAGKNLSPSNAAGTGCAVRGIC